MTITNVCKRIIEQISDRRRCPTRDGEIGCQPDDTDAEDPNGRDTRDARRGEQNTHKYRVDMDRHSAQAVNDQGDEAYGGATGKAAAAHRWYY